MAVNAPADAVNDADIADAGTVTDVGIVSTVASSVRVTAAPPTGATFVSVTVQVVLPFDTRLAAVHRTLETPAGATSAMVAVLETPLREAVMVAL